jgi:hypothetical protein
VSSSQVARIAIFTLWILAAMIATSAQLRVVAAPAGRALRYGIAWLICTGILGGLLVAMDRITGNTGTTRVVGDVALGAFVCAVALAAGSWYTNRQEWADYGKMARFLTLFCLHILVVLITAFPFI